MRALRGCTQHSTRVLVLLLATATATPLRAQTKTEAKQSAATKQSSGSQGVLPITDYGGDWNSRLALTGDWDGLRQRWADHGFTVDVNWTTYGQGVDSGGLSQGWEFGGQLDTVFHADLERMNVLYGGLVTMRVESRYGENANLSTGLILPVNTQASYPVNRGADADVPIAITALNYTQYFTDEFGVIAGKVQTEDGDPNEFAGGRGRAQFMNSAFVQSPATALTGPYSTLAAGLLWVPSETTSVSSTVMNLFDSSTTTGFDEIGNGGVWANEADFQWEGDLPGGMNVGGNYGFGADFTQILGQLITTPGAGSSFQNEATTWCVYWSAWQYLHAVGDRSATINTGNGRPDLEGIGLFARFGFADPDTNPIDWTASVGFGGRGVFGTRTNDTYGVGYYYSDLQQPRAIVITNLANHSEGVEAYYDIGLARSMSLTLDAQWVSGAVTNIDAAFILGFRFNVRL